VTPVTGVKAPDAAVIKGQGDFFTVKNAEKKIEYPLLLLPIAG
jgi:hypothetical protein